MGGWGEEELPELGKEEVGGAGCVFGRGVHVWKEMQCRLVSWSKFETA